MLKAESLVVSAGRDHSPGSPLNRPLVPASNFVLGTDRAYSRDDGTPTWDALEDIVGALEGFDDREAPPLRMHLYQTGPERYRLVGLERPYGLEPPNAR